MLMLMPDARFDGAAEYEQAVVGDRAEVRVYQANSLDDIPNDIWEAADGLMVWGRTPCNKDMLDRAKNTRIVIRMGVGYDVIDIEEAGNRRIVACNLPDYGTTAVSYTHLTLPTSDQV